MNRGPGFQACAACKFQRRKCAPDCPLARYFPAHHRKEKEFENAHKLFGVRKMLKHTDNLPQDVKDIVMKSLIYEANARARDPVGGCLRIICELQRQVQALEAELALVKGRLEICRAGLASGYPLEGDMDNFYDAVQHQTLQTLQLQRQQLEQQELVQQQEPQLLLQEQIVQGGSKIEADREESFVNATDSTKEQFMDVSDEVNPFLGGFGEREDTVFFEPKELFRYRGKVVLDDGGKLNPT